MNPLTGRLRTLKYRGNEPHTNEEHTMIRERCDELRVAEETAEAAKPPLLYLSVIRQRGKGGKEK